MSQKFPVGSFAKANNTSVDTEGLFSAPVSDVQKPLVSARDLRKRYKDKSALDGASFSVQRGRVVGLIGPNGAGKTTAIKAMLGLTRVEGELRVLGMDPFQQREKLMEEVCFIADVAILPRWARAKDLIDYTEGVHRKFDRKKCEAFLASTDIKMTARVGELSKGMIVQLHLALIMAIDAQLLVLDEPTLGLDILYRKRFYEQLLGDYFDASRTILITTHQVEEIEPILTDVLFINRGKIVLSAPMEELADRYIQITVDQALVESARQFKPISERKLLGKVQFLFDGVDRNSLRTLGELSPPSLSELFIATMSR
jgi:ABC-2 type transport system ATP-binding protein